MKIVILRDTVCAGKDVFEKDVIDAPDKDTKILIALKKAREFDPEKDTKKKK